MFSWRPDVPFNDLPEPPAAQLLETRPVLKAAIAANTALAQLDQAAFSMPNPTVLINSIPTLEAQASSEIENVVTTTDELFKHLEDDAGADPATRETLRYRTALRVGFDDVRERGLSVGTARAVCSTIKAREMGLRTLPGTRIGRPGTNDVVYSPPEGRDVLLEKLADWERFVHAEDGLDTLVRMAVAHYQFEAIHPFTDGNGRTGRILNVLMLVGEGTLRLPILYLSRYIIDTKNDYYRLLLAVSSERAWEDWILYVLRGVEVTSRYTLRKIAAIRALQDDFQHRARAATRGGADAEFQSVLFEQPYCRISTVMTRCAVSRPTATTWLNALVQNDQLETVKVGRDRLYINREFLRLLSRPEPIDGSRGADDRQLSMF